MNKNILQTLPQAVDIVAVTKTFPFVVVGDAYAAGILHVGENRVEEAKKKIREARQKGWYDIIWHMVGHVQGRKAKEVAALFDWVDSIDSIDVAQKIHDQSELLHKHIHVLLEVNLSGEKTKYGFDLTGWEKHDEKLHALVGCVRAMIGMKNLIIEGLMTMAPYTSSSEDNRPIFRSMHKLSNSIRAQIPSFGAELSMGTSCDYAVALQEGATQIRLGEALFGPRQ
jgi:PLP dependent protein